MPSYQGQISEQDLLKIIAYIKSIGQPGGEPMSLPLAVEVRRGLPARATRSSRGC